MTLSLVRKEACDRDTTRHNVGALLNEQRKRLSPNKQLENHSKIGSLGLFWSDFFKRAYPTQLGLWLKKELVRLSRGLTS